MPNELIIEEFPGKKGGIGRIILNRPEVLNALSENMCKGILEALEKWSANPKIQFVLIKGAGEKAFCAGGDIRQIHLQKNSTFKGNHPFFTAEYRMNKAIFHFKKPYISFLNGITMGGGVGVSLHGSHRIATEKLRLAMPETLIGFYPDVGVAYQLARLPKKFGWFLGLCGNTIGAQEALRLGLCTHFIEGSGLEDLEKELIESADIRLLEKMLFNPSQPRENEERTGTPPIRGEEEIEQIFSLKSLDAIFKNLEKSDHPIKKEIYESLQKRSPTSLKVTWELLNRCQHLSFDEIIAQNYDLTMHFLKGHDFFEGVRAQIIDKDKNPKWQPSKLSEIKDAEIEKYFLPY